MSNRIVMLTAGVSRWINSKITGITTARTGELLEMSDGSQWFHPYDGSAPVREAGPRSDWLI